MSTEVLNQIVTEFAIAVEQVDDFEFRVRFDKPQHAELALDEPAPLGKDRAPNATRILAAAIGNCLSASLLFCARKGKLEIGPIETRVVTKIARTPAGRLRVAEVDVEIDPKIPESSLNSASQCLELFEDFCTVTQSVRKGIPVNVAVRGISK